MKLYNKRIQLTVKSVTFFAKQKTAPLFTSADADVIRTLPLSLQGSNNTALTGSVNAVLDFKCPQSSNKEMKNEKINSYFNFIIKECIRRS